MCLLHSPTDSPLSLSAGEVHVWLAEWQDCSARGLQSSYAAMLDTQERKRLHRFAFDAPRQEFLLARVLCRTTLSRYLPLAPQEWRFETNRYGRPRIANGLPGAALDFNLTHSRGVVAMAVAHRDHSVGIDIECVDERRAGMDLAQRYFSPSESRWLLSLPAERRSEAFFTLWVLKEAYIKARGMGLSLPLDAFTIDAAAAGEQREITLRVEPPHEADSCDWQFAQRAYGTRHRLALCLRRRQGNETYICYHTVSPKI